MGAGAENSTTTSLGFGKMPSAISFCSFAVSSGQQTYLWSEGRKDGSGPIHCGASARTAGRNQPLTAASSFFMTSR